MLSSTTLRRSATNVHCTAPAVEQVGASIGRLDPLRTTCARAASITSRGWSVSSAAQSRKLERNPFGRGRHPRLAQ